MSFLEQVLDNLADGVTVQDRDFNIIYQNKAMQRFFGNHVGEKCYRVYEQRSAVCEGCALRAVMTTGQPQTLLRTAFEVNGTTAFWENSCSPVLDESGAIVGFAEVCRNVSGRVSLEEAFKSTNIQLGQLTAQLEVRVAERTAELGRANLYLDKIIDSIADPLVVKDRQGRWVLANRAVCELLGRSSEDLLGKTDFDLFPESEARVFQSSDERVLETGGEIIAEETITTPQAGRRVIVTKKTCFSDPSGEKRVVAIVRDITERKRLEEQLRQSQKMESIGMLAGGVAHDFNNLLTPILGGVELLLLDSNDTSAAALLRDMKHASERLKELTQHLLALGRKQVLELRRTDLRGVVQHFEAMLQRTLRENISIVTRLSADSGMVLADAGQIEQVLLNLAVNSQDAMPSGGTLTIETENVHLDEEYAASHPDARSGPCVQLSVSDTGCGMDAETQSRIFEPFFTTKEKGQGTGLGLSTVYGIVKQHGGSISVYSEPGHGATFKIYLPVHGAREAERADAVSGSVSATSGAEETVLVLEDNEMVRNIACEMLNRLGYHVLAADGPESCMKLARKHKGRIDLLLTDVVLRESNGREVFERLRREKGIARVIYMSGYTGNIVVHHGVLNEGVQFLQKPLSFSALANKVRHILDSPA